MTDAGAVDQDCYALEQVLFRGATRFQAVCIADTANFGRALFLDGQMQSAAADEALYHQMLVHPAMLLNGSPRSVLVLGGGEGASLREVIAHRSVERVVMVDLDGELIDLCRRYMPTWSEGAFEDPRVQLIISDAGDFVDRDRSRYDVVIIDLTDMTPGGPASSLYSQSFFEAIQNRLEAGGVLAIQAQAFSHIESAAHAQIVRLLRACFREVHGYTEFIPSFLDQWSFLLASQDASPRNWSPQQVDEAIRRSLSRGSLELDGAQLLGRFALPPRLALTSTADKAEL